MKKQKNLEWPSRTNFDVQSYILKCISGQLKTHLNLQLFDGAKYAKLREQIPKWDRAQAKWSQRLGAAEFFDVQAMEIDRIEGKGQAKGKGKGVSPRVKVKVRTRLKTMPIAMTMREKEKGSQDKTMGKRKGGKTETVCYVCNKPGHYAKDCWHNVRQVQTSVAGSFGQSDWTHVTSVSNQQLQTQSELHLKLPNHTAFEIVFHVSLSRTQLGLIWVIARNLHPNQMLFQSEWFTISLEMMLNCLFSLLTPAQW